MSATKMVRKSLLIILIHFSSGSFSMDENRVLDREYKALIDNAEILVQEHEKCLFDLQFHYPKEAPKGLISSQGPSLPDNSGVAERKYFFAPIKAIWSKESTIIITDFSVVSKMIFVKPDTDVSLACYIKFPKEEGIYSVSINLPAIESMHPDCVQIGFNTKADIRIFKENNAWRASLVNSSGSALDAVPPVAAQPTVDHKPDPKITENKNPPSTKDEGKEK